MQLARNEKIVHIQILHRNCDLSFLLASVSTFPGEWPGCQYQQFRMYRYKMRWGEVFRGQWPYMDWGRAGRLLYWQEGWNQLQDLKGYHGSAVRELFQSQWPVYNISINNNTKKLFTSFWRKLKNCPGPRDRRFWFRLTILAFSITTSILLTCSSNAFTLLFMLWIVSFIWFNRIAAFPPWSNWSWISIR